jgi:hypothetical protein
LKRHEDILDKERGKRKWTRVEERKRENALEAKDVVIVALALHHGRLDIVLQSRAEELVINRGFVVGKAGVVVLVEGHSRRGQEIRDPLR